MKTTPFFPSCRCDIGVHQDCYGVPRGTNADTWRCRRCAQQVKLAETAAEGRRGTRGDAQAQEQRGPVECCLCPVTGGALKPTTVDGLWAHLVCALWLPEPIIQGERQLEPIDNLLNVDLDRFRLLVSFH